MDSGIITIMLPLALAIIMIGLGLDNQKEIKIE
jgi:hypothetical protein